MAATPETREAARTIINALVAANFWHPPRLICWAIAELMQGSSLEKDEIDHIASDIEEILVKLRKA